MPQSQRLSSVIPFVAIERPACPKCKAPNVPHRHHDAIEFPDGSNVLVTLLIEGQRATVLQLPVVRQISERTTKAEEHGSTPAGRSCEVPAMPSGVSATKPEASAVTFFGPGTAGSP